MHVACSETNKLLGNIYDKFAQVETPSAKLATEGEARGHGCRGSLCPQVQEDQRERAGDGEVLEGISLV